MDKESFEQLTKLIGAAPPLLWIAFAVYAFAKLHPQIAASFSRLSSFEGFGMKVSLAGQAMDAARAMAKKHRNWADVEISAEDSRAALSRAQRERALLDGAEILWVDDLPANNRNEWEMFRQLGARITAAASTEEAMDALLIADDEAKPFHVIVSDMARGDEKQAGLAMLEGLRRRREPVIFYIGTIARDRGTPAGAFGITNRPDQLVHLVLDALARVRVPK
jgi:CheY-like chemotaxis protein